MFWKKIRKFWILRGMSPSSPNSLTAKERKLCNHQVFSYFYLIQLGYHLSYWKKKTTKNYLGLETKLHYAKKKKHREKLKHSEMNAQLHWHNFNLPYNPKRNSHLSSTDTQCFTVAQKKHFSFLFFIQNIFLDCMEMLSVFFLKFRMHKACSFNWIHAAFLNIWFLHLPILF